MLTDEEYKIRYKEMRRKNTYKKALILKNTFRDLFSHRSEKEILYMLSQCGHNYYGQKKKILSDDAKVMYEYLVTHNYNPSTVYKWFLLFITDEAIQQDIINNNLSQARVKRVIGTRIKQEQTAKTWEFMESARMIAGELLSYD